MKNIIFLVIFCFIGVANYSQSDNTSTLKIVSISIESASEPSGLQTTAIKADLSSEKMQADNSELIVVQESLEKASTTPMNVTATAELATDKNAQSSKRSTLFSQTNEIKLERQSGASSVKATAERAN